MIIYVIIYNVIMLNMLNTAGCQPDKILTKYFERYRIDEKLRFRHEK